MSFLGYKEIIQEGDLVLAYLGRDSMKPIIVNSTETLNTRFGSFQHSAMIGQKYGSQIASGKGYGYIHLLQPTAELWTLSLPHRTQIVYTPDSSYITQRLGITSGSHVIEAGTGSASFSHSLARTVSTEGKLFTFEFHKPRYEEAKREFEEHGILGNPVTINHRDVCNDGFEIEGVDLKATSIFLDLPSPWTAIPNLPKVISTDERVGICCFSPCIEQVDLTIKALQEQGWTSIEMVEIQGRRWEAKQIMVREADDAIERLKDVKRRKMEGIEKKRKFYSENGISKEDLTPSASETETEEQKKERLRLLEEEQERTKVSKTEFNPFGRGLRIREGDEAYQWVKVSKNEAEIKSHTSYLTFAYKQAPVVKK